MIATGSKKPPSDVMASSDSRTRMAMAIHAAGGSRRARIAGPAPVESVSTARTSSVASTGTARTSSGPTPWCSTSVWRVRVTPMLEEYVSPS